MRAWSRLLVAQRRMMTMPDAPPQVGGSRKIRTLRGFLSRRTGNPASFHVERARAPAGRNHPAGALGGRATRDGRAPGHACERSRMVALGSDARKGERPAPEVTTITTGRAFSVCSSPVPKVASTTPARVEQCAGRGSNPHCPGLEPGASASWATRAWWGGQESNLSPVACTPLATDCTPG